MANKQFVKRESVLSIIKNCKQKRRYKFSPIRLVKVENIQHWQRKV